MRLVLLRVIIQLGKKESPMYIEIKNSLKIFV